MAQLEMRPYEGLIDRAYEIFTILDKLPDDMSDVELDGILHVLPSDLRKTMAAFLASRIRGTSMKFLRNIKGWLDGAHRTKEEGGKVFLVPFNFPPETLYMFEGAWPVTSEVLSTLGVLALEGQGERYWDYAMGLGLPDFACSAALAASSTAPFAAFCDDV